jgi:hypothetical protein
MKLSDFVYYFRVIGCKNFFICGKIRSGYWKTSSQLRFRKSSARSTKIVKRDGQRFESAKVHNF